MTGGGCMASMTKQLRTKLIPVEQLKVNDLVDLQGDRFADDQTNAVIDYEYIRVVGEPQQETPECVAVPFDYDVVGFPLGHKVRTRVATVTFHPQVWHNGLAHGHAIDTDPEGPVDWEVQLADTLDADGNDLDNHYSPLRPEDGLRTHANAPQWVQAWSGPFYITINRDGRMPNSL